MFDNRRILNGRKAFKLPPGGQRHLQDVCMDWDEVYSRMRVYAGNQSSEVPN